ncbi:MAG: hypothetical protein ACJAYU_001366 [Bradymonadia bacterium]|jgi:hypothetical protein
MAKKRLTRTLGIDLGDRTCHFCIVTGVGGQDDITVVETAEVATTAEAFAE